MFGTQKAFYPTFFRLLILAVAASLVYACGGSSEETPAPSTGLLSVRITDAPVDMADNVFVQFSALELHGPEGRQTVDFDPPMQIDLMTLTGGKTVSFINDLELPAGRYQWMRLKVDTAGDMDTYIVIDGTPHELTIPSGDRNGLRLVSTFDVPAGGDAVYVVDFDLRKSVTQDAMGYKLRPTLRLLDQRRIGVISGNVDLAALQCAQQGAAVYVYSGLNQIPDDVGGTGTNPVTSALVEFNVQTSLYTYTVAFMHAGDYTVALTCMADMDDPMQDDDIQFIDPQNATVTKGATVTVNFPKPAS